MKIVIAIDSDNMIDVGFTGLNTRGGNQLSVKIKHNTPAASITTHRQLYTIISIIKSSVITVHFLIVNNRRRRRH